MASVLAIGVGVAAAAFLVRHDFQLSPNIINISQGRAGLVALRRSRGEAVGALGKAFYKGGFEPKMNRREAALILQLRYAFLTFWSSLC
jgi:DnaJ family protein C protein 19